MPSSFVYKIDTNTGSTVATVRVGTNPLGIAFDGTHIWVASRNSSNVSKIDVNKNSVVETVGVGYHPKEVAFDGTHIWITTTTNHVCKISALPLPTEPTSQ